ncbi:MAG: Fic family protein [Lactobacillaceae bacterium]|jgi:Fic family protein|nr:Fic family protein [Lactobacillaceae bacterium]
MDYETVRETAKRWSVSERSVRNYANNGRIDGAILNGKTWQIPVSAKKPPRVKTNKHNSRNLLAVLQDEKSAKIKGGIFHKLQIEMTYNSNHIEGSTLTKEQTRYIFETNTIGVESDSINVDDIVETANHFTAINYIIENATQKLSPKHIKEVHRLLKNGTSDSRKEWFQVGDYKLLPNEVGGKETTAPEDVAAQMKKLLTVYNLKDAHTFEEIIAFHYQFETIHPFQDGNGRVGRLIMFKELLKNDLPPFIITDELKWFYYRGLAQWTDQPGYLLETARTAQDKFKQKLAYFRIEYQD